MGPSANASGPSCPCLRSRKVSLWVVFSRPRSRKKRLANMTHPPPEIHPRGTTPGAVRVGDDGLLCHPHVATSPRSVKGWAAPDPIGRLDQPDDEGTKGSEFPSLTGTSGRIRSSLSALRSNRSLRFRPRPVRRDTPVWIRRTSGEANDSDVESVAYLAHSRFTQAAQAAR